MAIKKTSTPRTGKSVEAVKSHASGPKRIFGNAKGQIVFKKGWDAPMTKRELDDFLGRS
jgi:hypothetical protein